jgi:hypothetical protein
MEKIPKKNIILFLDHIFLAFLILANLIVSLIFLKNVPVILIVIIILSLLIVYLGYYLKETVLLKISIFLLASSLFFIFLRIIANLIEMYLILAILMISLDFLSNFISEKYIIADQIKDKDIFKQFIRRQKSKLYNEIILVLLTYSISVPLVYVIPVVQQLNSIYIIPIFLSIILLLIFLILIRFFR